MFFKGLTDWIEIFRGGQQTDMKGRTHDGDQLIENALAKSDFSGYAAPAVVGHPETDSPAYGWVQALREKVVDGVRYLEARFKDVDSGFEKAVKEGRYPNRSAAFYSDGRLRHVGFLGAAPPAVKGLKPVQFSEESGEAVVIEFSASDITTQPTGGKGMDLKEFVEAVKAFTTLGFLRAPKETETPAATPSGGDKMFTEAELKAQVEAAEKAAKEKAAAEFAEQTAKETAEKAKAARQKELEARVDKLVADGKITPAFAENLKPNLLVMDVGEMAFADGKKATMIEFQLAAYEQGEKSALFSEIATKDRQGATDGAAFAQAKKEWDEGLTIAATVNPPKQEG